MKKVIDKGREPVIHYFCDGCKRQVANPPENLSYSLQVVGNFGYGSEHDGLIFNHAYCEDCGIKAIEAIELSLKIEIKAGDNILFDCDTEDCDTENADTQLMAGEQNPDFNSDDSSIPKDVAEGWD
jgi:hypothetical protein